MTGTIHRFLGRLSPEGIERLFDIVKISGPNLAGLGRRQRAQIAMEVMDRAGSQVRARVEGIAGHIVGLADKGDCAERALHAVCEDRPDLLDVLERELSPEDRILIVWQTDPKLLDKARNLAMAFHWRWGRWNTAFHTEPTRLAANLDDALEAIRKIVQQLQGGRKIWVESSPTSIPMTHGRLTNCRSIT
jgi:hypothetical protein